MASVRDKRDDRMARSIWFLTIVRLNLASRSPIVPRMRLSAVSRVSLESGDPRLQSNHHE